MMPFAMPILSFRQASPLLLSADSQLLAGLVQRLSLADAARCLFAARSEYLIRWRLLARTTTRAIDECLLQQGC